MAKTVACATNARSEIRAAVEHVFARQKGPMGLVVRTIGLARAIVKVGLANIAFNSSGLRDCHGGVLRRAPHRPCAGRPETRDQAHVTGVRAPLAGGSSSRRPPALR